MLKYDESYRATADQAVRTGPGEEARAGATPSTGAGEIGVFPEHDRFVS